jgi:hypothetical protein
MLRICDLPLSCKFSLFLSHLVPARLTELTYVIAHTGQSSSPRAGSLRRTLQHFSKPGATTLKLRCRLNKPLDACEICLEILEVCLLMAKISQALLCLEASRAHKVFLPLGETCLRITE